MNPCKIDFVEYTKDFLDLSWEWLNDPEIKVLTMTPDFTMEEQDIFFNNLPRRTDYKISGILINGAKAGACGLKNIKDREAELWCYIGLKQYWGAGLSRFIIEHIQAESNMLNISCLYLKVSRLNIRAIKVYEKNGFSKVSEFPQYFLMSKQI